MIRVCFVCLGNICRSPTAEGVMRDLIRRRRLEDRIVVDSAGTGAWHVGESPDPRTVAAALRNGVTLEHQARQFRAADFARFDLIVAMDLSNLRNLERIAPDAAARQRIALLRSFDAGAPPGAEVPDPYAGGVEGFDEVFAICLRACTGLLDHLATRA